MKYKPGQDHPGAKVYFSLVDMDKTIPDPQALRLLPGKSARHLQVLPLEISGNTLTLATARPGNSFVHDTVEFQVGRRTHFVIADADELRAAIDRAYPPAGDAPDGASPALDSRELRKAYLEKTVDPDLARRLSDFEDARRDALGSSSSKPAKPKKKE